MKVEDWKDEWKILLILIELNLIENYHTVHTAVLGLTVLSYFVYSYFLRLYLDLVT